MPGLRSLTFLAVFFTAACATRPPQPTPVAAEHALAAMAAERVVVLPTYIARVQAPLDWSIGRPTELQRTLDAEIASAFEERGLRRTWIFPEQLVETAKRNASYATDPYQFAEEPLRSPSLAVEARLPEPLASQVRTVIAFYQDVRFVLVPVELRLEPVKPRGGRGVLRVVLLDARLSNVRWIGDIESDPLDAFGPAIPASIAARLAAVVSPR